MPITSSANVKPFFDRAKALGLDVAIGYGEQTPTIRYNAASYVSKDGRVLNKYRKVSCCSIRPNVDSHSRHARTL